MIKLKQKGTTRKERTKRAVTSLGWRTSPSLRKPCVSSRGDTSPSPLSSMTERVRLQSRDAYSPCRLKSCSHRPGTPSIDRRGNKEDEGKPDEEYVW